MLLILVALIDSGSHLINHLFMTESSNYEKKMFVGQTRDTSHFRTTNTLPSGQGYTFATRQNNTFRSDSNPNHSAVRGIVVGDANGITRNQGYTGSTAEFFTISRPGLMQGLEFDSRLTGDGIVIDGNTEYSSLKNTKDLLLELIREFQANRTVTFEGNQKDDYNRRLILLENEIEGSMRRMLGYNQADSQGNIRRLDYDRLLCDKENEIVEKGSRICNLEEKLKESNERELALELETQRLNQLLVERNNMLQELRRQLEVRTSAVEKIKLQANLVNLPEMAAILRAMKEDEGRGSRADSDVNKLLAQLERDLSAVKSKLHNLDDLESTVRSWLFGLPTASKLRRTVETGELRMAQEDSYRAMQEKFRVAADLYRLQIEKVRQDNPNLRFSVDERILDTLRSKDTRVSVVNSVVEVQKAVTVTREVPVQDSRTKHLIHAFMMHLKRLHEKYPKLKSEMDPQLSEFLSTELIDVMQADEMDRIVDVIKYVPQTVRVENVYVQGSKSDRKVQFHLRVLIKSLLDEMQKVQKTKGVTFDLDEGVIGMIRNEIMDVVNVDDILRVYRSAPKVVEVEKVVEKVVDNIVRVPEKYALNQLETKTQQLQKPFIATDEKALFLQYQQGVPLYREKAVQLPSTEQKVVPYPELHQRVAVETREKTKVQPVEALVQKIVEVQKPVFVTQEKVVVQKELQEVEVVKEVVRYVETTQQIPKPIEVMVEKIVEKVVERERIVQVPTIVEKVVQVIRYEKAPEIVPYVQTRVQVVREIVEKIVPVVQIEEKLVMVPQIVEKIVTVQKVVERPPKEIEIIKEVLRVQKEYQIVQVEVPKIIIQKEVEIRQVQKYVQVPMMVPQVRVETQIHQVPLIETVEKVVHVPVEVLKHVVLAQEKPVEVIKNVPYIMKEEVPVPMREEKIVPVEMYFERIKEVPTIKEKIVEKIVEVPKTVEIEKIVEKIVIVPRIIEKIVQVPQIIEKIVEKIVQVPIQMPPVEHIIEKPCRVQVPVEVYRDKIVYVTVDRAVEVPGNTVLVVDKQCTERVKVEKIIEEHIRVHKEEVPVEIYVDKIISYPVQTPEVHYVEKVIVKPIEVPVPITLEKTVPVYINTETVRVEPVPHVVEKIVERVVNKVEPRVLNQVQQKVAVQQRYQFQQVPKVYIEKELQQIDVIKEKIVETHTTSEVLKEVPYMMQKLVTMTKEVPKVYQYEKEAKVVYMPATVEVVDRIVPQIINVNKYIERIVEKLVEVPHLLREIEVVKEMHERNVPGPQNTNTVMKTVDLAMEKEVIREKERVVTERVNSIEQVLQVVSDIMERDREPVIITHDRVIEVPHVLEKIVERMVIMPQVHEVLKYVHEVFENDNQAVGAGLDIGIEAKEYKVLGEELEGGLADFLTELNKFKSLQPSSAPRIALLEQYLSKFRRFIKYPKIHELIREKVVEKEKFVKVPAQRSEADTLDDLAKMILIEKLVTEISRLKQANPSLDLQLDDDVKFIFGLSFDGKVKDVSEKLNSQLREFEQSLNRKFSKMGGWSLDHQEMLRSFLQQRFMLANIVKNSNQEIKLAKRQNEQLAHEAEQAKALALTLSNALKECKSMMPDVLKVLQSQDRNLALAYSALIRQYDEVFVSVESVIKQITHSHTTTTRIVNDSVKHNLDPSMFLGRKTVEALISSSLREKQREIQLLREKLRSGKTRESDHAQCNTMIHSLEIENARLKKDTVGQHSQTAVEQYRSTIRKLESETEKTFRQLQQSKTSQVQSQMQIKSLQAEIQRLNKSLQEGGKHDQCNSKIRSLEREIEQLKLQLMKAGDHDQCESKIAALRQQYELLEIKLKEARQEIANFQVIQSPKNSLGTAISVTSPVEIKKSYVVAVRSESESSDKGEFYGSNYAEYVNNDIHNNEIIGNIRQNTYSSSHLGGSREQRGSDSGDYNSQNAGYGFQFNDFINRSPVQTTMPFAPTSLGTNLLTMPNGSLGVQQSYSTQRISVNQTNFVTSSQQRTFKTAEFSSGFEGNEIQYADDSGRVTRQHSDL